MGLGDMMGKAMGALGGGDIDIAAKLEEMGVDASMLEGLDLEAAKSFIEEKGIDLSMLENLGIDLDEVLAKLTGKS